MSGQLAIDFGTSNTVLALRDGEAATRTIAVGDYSEPFEADVVGQCPVIPSFIHYSEDGRTLIGSQAKQRRQSPRTFSLMKRYIAQQIPSARLVGDRTLSFSDAGNDFLRGVLTVAGAEHGIEREEIAFTVPVEAYEHYENWVVDVAEVAGFPRFRVIDEASAAALGYGAHIQPGDVYLVFDFGGGTLDCSIVLIEEEERLSDPGRRCRVLGKAGTDLGGATIDTWIYELVLERAGMSSSDEEVVAVSNALLEYCERAKIRLSNFPRADIALVDPDTARVILSDSLSRDELEDLLDEHQAFTAIERTLAKAFFGAEQRGYDSSHVKNIFLVGGTCLMPTVRKFVQRRFGRERVLLDRPIDAVARGAAAFASGIDFYDHIQHDYALRVVDQMTGQYRYETLVERGTPYPSERVRSWTIKATHDGQARLGLAIFEVGERPSTDRGTLELVFDPGGGARLRPLSAEHAERRSLFWMNEEAPTFLDADPPAAAGEERFVAEFSIDSNKRLLISARDLRGDRPIVTDVPVVRLT